MTLSPSGSFSEWLGVPPGRFVLERELETGSRIVSDLFGYHLLLVGGVDYEPLLWASRTQHAGIVQPPQLPRRAPVATRRPVVTGEPTALPVCSDSVDVVVLPHVLEFTPQPHEALREAERILVGEGHLLLIGFNPWSLMGLRRLAGRRRSAPWSGQFLTMSRIRDWLALLGFDVVSVSAEFFRPPIRNEGLLERMRPLEEGGRRFLPYLGGSYLFLARKRVSTVTPIRPRWRARPSLVGVGIAEPTPRTGWAERGRSARRA